MFTSRDLHSLVERIEVLQARLREFIGKREAFGARWSLAEVAAWAAKSPDTIRRAEQAGLLDEPEKNSVTGRRKGYTVDQVRAILSHFKAVPQRPSGTLAPVIAFHNLKGGVAKTTTAVHVAQYCAIRGHKVLLLDADSQASATRMFGFTPDIDFAEPEHTIEGYLRGDQRNLSYAVHKTHVPGLDLIPSSLAVFYAEFTLSSRARKDPAFQPLYELRAGLHPLREDYDIILIDAPPSLALLGLNVMYAATALVVPVPPAMLDFASSMQYIEMLESAAETLEERGEEPVDYEWFKVLITRQHSANAYIAAERGDKTQRQEEMLELIHDFFGPYLMRPPLLYSAEIESASNEGKTLFDLEEPIGTPRTHKRARSSVYAVCEEVYEQITSGWRVRK